MATQAIEKSEGGQGCPPSAELTGADGLSKDANRLLDQFEGLAERIDGIVSDLLPLAFAAKRLFASKPRLMKIRGCSTFDAYVEQVFKKSARTVRRMLAKQGKTDKRFANKKPKALPAPAESQSQTAAEPEPAYLTPSGRLTEKAKRLIKANGAPAPETDLPAGQPHGKLCSCCACSRAANHVLDLRETFYVIRRKSDGKFAGQQAGYHIYSNWTADIALAARHGDKMLEPDWRDITLEGIASYEPTKKELKRGERRVEIGDLEVIKVEATYALTAVEKEKP